MKSLLPILTVLALLISAPSLAQKPSQNKKQTTDPRAIVSAAREACLGIRTAAYSATYEWLDEDGSSTYEGKIVVRRDTSVKDLGALVRMELKEGLVYAFDGSTLRLLIPKEKKLRVADSTIPGVNYITGNVVGHLVETPMIVARPFASTLDDSTTLRYGGTETVAGVRCHKITAVFPPAEDVTKYEADWYFGVDDGLPRRRVVRTIMHGSERTTDLTIRDLRANLEVDLATFTATAPDGWITQVDTPYVAPELLAVGEMAPEWTLLDHDGKEVSLSDYRGRVVLLDFWYTTCHWCVKAMPAIQKIHERFASRGVEVIGVNCFDWRNEKRDPVGFMRERNFTYDLVMKADTVAERYHVSGYPTLYIVGVDGKIILAQAGYHEELESHLAGILDGYLKDAKIAGQ